MTAPAQEPGSQHLFVSAAAQYRLGAFNRRVAAETGNLLRLGMGGESDVAEFLCTCGRRDCQERLQVSLREHESVRARPYRFLVAPNHATEIDDVVADCGSYWIVEVKREYRLSDGDHRRR